MSKYIKKVKVVKPVSHIIADSNYSVFHYTDGTKMMFSLTLKNFDDQGIRIHKSVIVNPDQIKQILNFNPIYLVKMQDNSVHPVARRRVKGFIEYANGRLEQIKSA